MHAKNPLEREDPWKAGGQSGHASLFVFRLFGERFAFEAALAQEVIRLGPLTRLPASRAFLLGVFNHRGEVLAVMDLAQILAEESTSLAHGSRAVIVQSGEWKLAVVAEALEGLVSIPASHLEPPPASGPGPSEFLKYVASTEDGPLAVLDLPRIVASARAKGVES